MENMEKKENREINMEGNPSAGKKSGSFRKGVIVLASVLGELPQKEEKEKFSRLSYYKNGRFENEEMVKFFPKEKRKKRSKFGMFRFLFKSPNAPEEELPKVHLSPADFSGKKENNPLQLGKLMLSSKGWLWPDAITMPVAQFWEKAV